MLAGTAAMLGSPAAARAQARNGGVALVIGNSKYLWEAQLANVRRDAPDVAKAFQSMGLKTELVQDVGRDDLRRAVDKFKTAASGAKFAAFYYAGHGASWEKDTYLVSVDADLGTPSAVKTLLPVSAVTDAMRSASSRLLVFDNCRNNPADGWRQLAAERQAGFNADRQRADATDANTNSLTLYSTAPGHVALDGPPGQNSPFAAAFLDQLANTSVDLQALPAKLRRELLIDTEGRQVVWDRNNFQSSFIVGGAVKSGAGAPTGAIGHRSRRIHQSNAYPFANFRNLPFGRENTYRVGLSASQALFTGGRVRGLSQSAAAGLRSAELGVTSAQAQTVLDVTQAYYDASLGDRLVAIAEATLQQADTTLSQTQLAREVGNQSEFELLRARVTRDNQRPVVIQRRADRDLAYYRLKQLLELPLDLPLQLTTELGDTALVQAPELARIVESPGDTTVGRRLAVRQAQETVHAQEGQLRVARAQRFPQLTLSSDFADLGYPSTVSPFGTSYVSDWNVSLALTLPFFTGGRIRGEVESARANVEQAALRLKQTQERAELDARSAQLQVASAVAAWEASAGTEEQAERAYRIAELRYREGLSTQTELNDQRIALAQAQSTRARAARDLQVAKVRLLLLPSLPLPGTTTGAATTATGATGAVATPAAATTPVIPTSTTTSGFTR